MTQPCFIRKNTPELRKKLEELGYEPYRLIKKHPDVWHGISAFNSTYYGLGINELENYAPKEHYEGKYFIDCGTNENLFIALASLRDDTIENQWFTDGEIWVHLLEGYQHVPLINYILSKGHKATPAELIEHFNKK